MAVRSLKSFLPTADDVLALDLPKLGEILLVHLNSYEGRVKQNGRLNQGYLLAMLENRNVGLGALPKEAEYGARQPDVTRRVMEAWNWLERQGMLICDPTCQGWHIISTEGERLLGGQNNVDPLGVSQTVQDSSQDRRLAQLAVEEARKSIPEGDGRTHPNVGVVIARNGKVLAQAHRGEFTANHAEYIALEKKLPNESLVGATVYTTLEPCTNRNHPKVPCAKRLIERKVARVLIGMLDPNPAIRGRGQRELFQAGITTEFFPHDLMCEVEELNRDFTRGHNGDEIPAAEAPEKIIAGLNTQSFFVTYAEPSGDFRASDYIRLIAAPRSGNTLQLDQAVQRSFERHVKSAFLEVRGFDQVIPRGEFYQIQSHVQSRSCTHRVWCLWRSGAVGYTANLDRSNPLPIGDLVLHYIFFLRLAELVLGPSAEIVVFAQLASPRARFTPYFPDSDGSLSDYDRVSGVRFDERHPYVRVQIESIEELRLPVENVPQKLADLILFQVQETSAARIDFEKWLEAITDLFRHTSFRTWGALR